MDCNRSQTSRSYVYAATSLGVIFDGLTQNISRLELTPAEPVNKLNDRRYLDVYYQDGAGHHKLDPEDWEFSLDGPTGRITIAFPDLLSAYEVRIHCRFDDRDADFQPIDASELLLVFALAIVYVLRGPSDIIYLYDKFNFNKRFHDYETITSGIISLEDRIEKYILKSELKHLTCSAEVFLLIELKIAHILSFVYEFLMGKAHIMFIHQTAN